METPAKAGREYWRRVLAAGGSTAIPRWTLDPVPGVGECTVALPDAGAMALRGPAGEPVSSGAVVLAAHAVVLAALSGERDVVTGYVAAGDRVLPCRLATEAGPWRSLVAEAARAEGELLRHAEVAVEDLRREMGVAGPSFTTLLDPTGDGDLTGGAVLRVGVVNEGGGPALRLRYRTEVLDAGGRRPDRRLPPHRAGADRGRPGRGPPRADPAVRRGAAVPAGRAGGSAPGAAGPPVPRAVRGAGGGAPGRSGRGARGPGVDLPGAERPGEPPGSGAAGPRAAARGRGRGGDRAQPRLDGVGARGLQGGRGVPADRAALPGRPDREDADPGGVPAGADRDRQHDHAGQGDGLGVRGAGRAGRRRLRGGPRRREPGCRRSARTSWPTSTSPPAPPASRRARCASTRGCSTTSRPRSTTWGWARGRWSPRSRPSASTSRCGSWCRRCWWVDGRCSSSRR